MFTYQSGFYQKRKKILPSNAPKNVSIKIYQLLCNNIHIEIQIKSGYGRVFSNENTYSHFFYGNVRVVSIGFIQWKHVFSGYGNVRVVSIGFIQWKHVFSGYGNARVVSIGFIQWKHVFLGYGKVRVVTIDTDQACVFR